MFFIDVSNMRFTGVKNNRALLPVVGDWADFSGESSVRGSVFS